MLRNSGLLFLLCLFYFCTGMLSWAQKSTDRILPEKVIYDFKGFQIRSVDEREARTIPGPLPGMVGVEAGVVPVQYELILLDSLPSRGSLSFWIRIDQTYFGGIEPEQDEFEEEILSGPFTFSCRFTDNFFRMQLNWDGPGETASLPAVKGPAWYHLAYDWDAERGIFRAYLNGTPTRIERMVNEPWEMSSFEPLTLNPGRFGIADLRIGSERTDRNKLRKELTPLYYGSMDYLLGAVEKAPYVIEQNKGRLLYENALRKPEDIEDWVFEGPGAVSFENGWMRMASDLPEGRPGHIVHWCPFKTPDNYIVEFDIQIEEPHLAIVFFSSQGRNGKSVFDPELEKRDGIFNQYVRGDLDTYHISYYAHNRGTVNLRKSPGMYLPAVGPPLISRGSKNIHTIQVMKNGGHIQLAIDGEVSFDYYDCGNIYGPVLGAGNIGLRQMQYKVARYRDFRIYAIKPDKEEKVQFGSMPRP